MKAAFAAAANNVAAEHYKTESAMLKKLLADLKVQKSVFGELEKLSGQDTIPAELVEGIQTIKKLPKARNLRVPVLDWMDPQKFKGIEVTGPGDAELKIYTLAAKTLAIFEFVSVFTKGTGSYLRVEGFIKDRAVFCFRDVCLYRSKMSI